MSVVGDIMVKIAIDMKDFHKGLGKAEKSLKGVGDKFKSVGEGLSKAITLPLMAVGGVSLASASDAQKSHSLIQAQLGLTAKEAEELQGVITNLYKKGFGGDLQEVTNAVTNIKRNMKDMSDATEAELERVAKSTMNLSTVFDQDVNDITKAVNSMQQAFGNVSVEEAFDMIAKGFQNGLDYSNEFLDSINEYSVHFSELGFSSAEMFSLFQKSAESGVFQLDKAGDLIKELNIRLSDGTADEYMDKFTKNTQKLYAEFKKTGENGTEVFQAIMKEIANAETETEAYQIGVGVMGTMFEDLDFKAVQALANIGDEFSNTKGTMDELNNSVNNDLGTKLTGAFREVKTALAPVGEALCELVDEYLPPLVNAISGLGEKFASLSPKTQMAVLAIAGLALVLPPIIIAIGLVINSIGAMVGAFGVITGAFGKVGGDVAEFGGTFKKLRSVLNLTKILPLVTSPIGLIILAVGALIAAVVVVWKNWDTIWTKIKDTAVKIWTDLVNWFNGMIQNLKDWFANAWSSIKEKTVEIWTSIVDSVKSIFQKIYDALGIQKLVDFVKAAWELIRDTISITSEMIVALARAIWLKLLEYIMPIVESVVDFVSNAWSKLKEKTTSIYNATKDFIVNIWQSISNYLSSLTSSIVNYVKEKFDKLKNNTKKTFDSVKSTLSNIWDSVLTKVKDITSKIYNNVKDKFDNAKKAITKPIEDAKKTISRLLDDIKGFFTNLKLKIPLPQIPKISVEKGYKEFLGQQIPYPKFKVSWNAKGNIFNGATLLGGGQGVGEAGAEVVMPIQHKRYMQPFSSSIAEHLDKMQGNDKAAGVVNNFYISELVVREEADIERIASELERKQRKEQRAKGTFSFA